MASTRGLFHRPTFRRASNVRLRLQLAQACVVFLFVLGIRSPASAAAGSPEVGREINVVTAPIAPFVLRDRDRLTGFSIDVWSAVATRAGLQFSWTVVATVADLLDAVKRGDADVGISAIVITPQREQMVDFAHPYFNSGLQIMVRAQNTVGLWDAIREIPWSAIAELLGATILIVFLLANVLWLVERRRNPDFKGAYLPALGEALWGTMLIVATGEHGERNAPGVVKRVTVVGMWLLGVLLIAQLTATVTSSQTLQRLKSNIRGPEDLPGKVIGTVSATVAADYLTKRGLPFVGLSNADDAIRSLSLGEVQAVVFGAPTLQYWVAKHGGGELQVVGPLFQPERIGIADPQGSTLRKRINTALDELYEDGSYSEIYARWFVSVVSLRVCS
jgi:polar amino acid transport system substrate-binding protein